MSERSRTWNGAPTRWTGAVPSQPDPTGGRHAFDEDAALTPIFTALRRGGWRRPRPWTAADPGLRLAPPPPTDRIVDGPPTAPIPVVPALYSVAPQPTGGFDSYGPPAPRHHLHDDGYDDDGYDGYDHDDAGRATGGYVADGYASAPGYAEGYRAEHGSGGYADHTADVADGYGVDGYRADGYGVDGYGVDGYGADGYGADGYRAGSVDPYPRSSFTPLTPVPAPAPVTRAPAPPPQEATTWWRRPGHDPHSAVTDSGRHHRRLAPAGW